MKIIVKDKEEYEDLLKACQVIHDFTVWTPTNWEDDTLTDLPEGTVIGVTYQQASQGKEYVGENYTISGKPEGTAGICIPLEEYPILNFLAGIYDTDNKEWIKSVVSIESELVDNLYNGIKL